jgi:hypothetical protein
MALLELMAALAVGTVLFIGLSEMIDVSLEDARGQQVAYQHAQLAEAAQKYIAANYPSLVSATASAVAAVTVTDLKAAGFLPNGFTGLNSYGQNTCVLVRQPGAGKLDALVATYGGQPIPERILAIVAMGAGQGAGYITGADSGNAHAPSWSVSTTPYQSVPCGSGPSVLAGGAADGGHLVSNLFNDGPGWLPADFVYRDSHSGQPGLNQMNTPLLLGGDALRTAGTACGADPALAIDIAAEELVVCNGGVWSNNASSWRAPLAKYAALVSAGGSPGTVRLALSSAGAVTPALDQPRAYAYRNSSAWDALAVNENGNMRVPGTMYSDSVLADGHIQAYGNVGAVDIVAKRDIRESRDIRAGNDITADGVLATWMNSGAYQIGYNFNPGEPCNYVIPNSGGNIESPTGTLVKDDNGVTMSCNTNSTFRYVNGTYSR